MLLKADSVFIEGEGDLRGLKNKRTGETIKKSRNVSRRNNFLKYFSVEVLCPERKLDMLVSPTRTRGRGLLLRYRQSGS